MYVDNELICCLTFHKNLFTQEFYFHAALETFLTALARQEMNQMPRGVYHSALSGGTLRSDQGKTVAGIPLFMLKTYEKNKQPGLKPGLAGTFKTVKNICCLLFLHLL